MVYRKIFLCSLMVGLILIFSSGSCLSKGLHFGIISAVKEKIDELKEKIQEQTSEVTLYQSETGADGIAWFTLDNGQTASVKAIDQRTGDPLSGIDAYLITNGTDGVYFLVDPEQNYLPRFVNATAESSSEWIVTVTVEGGLWAWDHLTSWWDGELHTLSVDRVPPSLQEYIREYSFTWYRDTTFGHLRYDIEDIAWSGIDAGASILLTIFFPPAGVGEAIGSVATGGIISLAQTITEETYDEWANYYIGTWQYQPSDECEIWKANQAIFDPLHLGHLTAILVVPKEARPEWSATGSISGIVTDAQTGQGLANVELKLDHGSLSTWSQSDGSYRFSDLPVNGEYSTYRITATKVGYDIAERSDIQVYPGEETSNINIALNPAIIGPSGEYRIVLTWGENPRDLDSHLWTPSIEGSTYHVWYVDMGSLDSPPYANLDVDDITSYGPETVTISTVYPGIYTYAVHHYNFWSDDYGTITTSGAVVKIYSNVGLLREFSVPTTESGSGWWWRVFTLDGSTGEITEINTITADPPIAYNLVPTPKREHLSNKQ